MYKTKLQDICHQRVWALPNYTSIRSGPDHDPRFRVSVTVNGLEFESPDESRSVKEAQNKAAHSAVDHIEAVLTPPPASPRASPSEVQISYKTELQNILAKKKLVPIYKCPPTGPPHAARFKGVITVDGQTFESPELYSTVKEAERAVAKVAFLAFRSQESQSQVPSQQVESGFYKNYLQELLQKEGNSLPEYNTEIIGSSHMPTFITTINIGDEKFKGDVAKTKKQAELNAARVAWLQLKERREKGLGLGLSSGGQMQNGSQAVSTMSLSEYMNLQQPTVQVSSVNIDAEKENSSDNNQRGMSAVTEDRNGGLDSLGKTVETGSSHTGGPDASPPPKMAPEVIAIREGSVDCASPEGILSLNSGSSSSGWITGEEDSLVRNKLTLFPRRPNMVLPEGATVLPFSDDKWVAVSFGHEVN